MTRSKKARLLLTIMMAVIAIGAVRIVPIIAQPGDASDPLVTRSFVESRIAQVMEEINQLRQAIGGGGTGYNVSGGVTTGNLSEVDRNALFEEFLQYFDVIYGDMLRTAVGMYPPTPPDAIVIPPLGGTVVPFEALMVPEGRTLIGHAGAEFILRGGSATAVSGPDGMVDVTAGRDVVSGETMPTNHLLLVPRSDGRGFIAHTDVWVMIKGGFDIVD